MAHPGQDTYAEALLDWIYRLQAEEGDPDLKVLVFTEFVPTQEMLYEFLTERGFPVVCLNGAMDMEERRRVQDGFATVKVLASSLAILTRSLAAAGLPAPALRPWRGNRSGGGAEIGLTRARRLVRCAIEARTGSARRQCHQGAR